MRKTLIKEREFLTEIEAAAKRLGISPGTLCFYAVQNGRLPKRLEGGQTVTLDTIRRVRAWIDTHRKVA